MACREKERIMQRTGWRAIVVRSWTGFVVFTATAAIAQEQNPSPPTAPADAPSPQGQPEGSPPGVQPSPQDVRPSPQAPSGASPDGACNACGHYFCLGLCNKDGFLDPKRGFFALGQPHQFVPPPTGWMVIVPPIPPPPAQPKPGEPAPPPPPPRPFRPQFYENDFRYLDKPDNKVVDPFDFLKRIPLTPSRSVKTDIGGEFRWQSKLERNRRLDGLENKYNLFRERLYVDTWYQDIARVYFETIWADSSRQTQPPLPIDINHGDLLNAFGELRLFKRDERTLSARYGRQELLFGNQRLVSPLDWGNTRRTFDDVARLLYRSQNWAIDGFWGRPVVPDPRRFDHGDQSRQFFGTYAVYKGIPNQVVDLYYLGLVETDPVARGRGGVMGGFDVQTLGMRWQGSRNDWLWETEAAYQFGKQADLNRNAGMAVGGVGRRFSKAFGKPELWFYYDWASGDRNPNDDDYNTFNQLFPLGHKYFGYLDIVGRQNIQDPNVIFTIQPHKRLKLLAWYHHFTLDSQRDALYNAAGVPTRRDPTGRSGPNVGDEIDFAMDLIVNPHADFNIGYSHFFPGGFIDGTGLSRDSSFFYSQFLFRF
jgi:hypothetical protein